MPIDLTTWVPQKIINIPNDQPGAVITSEQWIGLWQLSIGQGDNSQETLQALLAQLYDTAWHPTAGALTLYNPALYAEGATNVSEQLDELLADLGASQATLATAVDNIADLTDGTTAAGNSAKLGGELPAAYALASTTEDLQDQIDAISAGEIAAFSHNDISNRSATDAHPLASITGLQTALDAKALASTVAAMSTTHAGFADKNDANSHLASAIKYNDTLSVAAKIAALDVVLASISGDITAIEHNDLTLRDAADAHPISAVTGLQAALDLKATAANLSTTNSNVSTLTTNLGTTNTNVSNLTTTVNGKQKQVTASTAAPSGGSDGDVWIKYG